MQRRLRPSLSRWSEAQDRDGRSSVTNAIVSCGLESCSTELTGSRYQLHFLQAAMEFQQTWSGRTQTSLGPAVTGKGSKHILQILQSLLR
jgi:hypothetical protein